MANEIYLPYRRFVRRAQSNSKAIVGWKTTMSETFEALKVAPWRLSAADLNNITMPVNAPLTFTDSDEYDTFKMTSTSAGAGTQVCHMGMAAYRYKIPADAISGSKYPTNITLSLGTDKFNTSGLRVAAYLSNATTPPSGWTECREGTEFIPDETLSGVTLGILASRTPTVATATNASSSYSLSFSPAISANNSYLYIILSNYDYTSYRASREYYIEGAGILDGANVQVGFASAVTPDADTTTDLGQAICENNSQWGGEVPTTNLLYHYNAFPGFTNTFTLKTTGTSCNLGAWKAGTSSDVVGAICNGVIKTKEKPFTRMDITDFTASLSGIDCSLLINAWAGTPPATTNGSGYGRTASYVASANSAATWDTFAKGTSPITLKVTATGSSPEVPVSLTNIGQAILQKGENYVGYSMPVVINSAPNTTLNVFVAITPYDLGSTYPTGSFATLSGSNYLNFY
jgi:hypothetical protein